MIELHDFVSARRRNYREEEKEPEWFTGGPTSQMETIELRGFEKEGDHEMEDGGISLRPNCQRQDSKKRSTPSNMKPCKDKGMASSTHNSFCFNVLKTSPPFSWCNLSSSFLCTWLC